MTNQQKVGIQEGMKLYKTITKVKKKNGKRKKDYLSLATPEFKLMIMARYIPLSFY